MGGGTQAAGRRGWSRREFLESLVGTSIGVAGSSVLAGVLIGPRLVPAGDGPRATRNLFRVTDAPFGAIGDGLADDAPAIQAAIDAASAAGGGVILLPQGTYRLQSVQEERGVRYFLLNIPSHVTLLGAGIDQTLLRAGEGLPDQTRMISTMSSLRSPVVMQPHFEDFTLDGNAAAQPDAASCVGISCVHASGARHVRVRVHDIKGTSAGEGTCFDSYFATGSSYDNCEALRTGPGPTGSGFSATASRTIGYQDCRASGSTHWMGFTTFMSQEIGYVRCHGFQNAQRGLNCEQSHSVSYQTCRAGGPGLGNSGDGFYLFRSSGITLADCSSAGNRNGLLNLGSTGVEVIRGSFEEDGGDQAGGATGP